jgi:hypothetical protein
MTHTRQMADSEGDFGTWTPTERTCHQMLGANQLTGAPGLPCGHPVEYRVWESFDGAHEDYQYRCIGGGHLWWVDGIDS